MPGFAKFLAFLTVVAACGFLYLATLDFNARRPFAREVFLAELAIDGLPVNRSDPGPRRVDIALWQDIDSSMLDTMFAHAGGPKDKGAKPVEFQEDEVKRVQQEVEAQLKVADENDKRQKLKDIFLPLAYTLEERDFWIARISDKDIEPNKLQEELMEEYFGPALKDEGVDISRSKRETKEDGKNLKPEKHSRVTRRQYIAHLLYNLSGTTQSHQRTMVVIGLQNFINEAEGQAARLREMSLRTRMAMVSERGIFEEQHQRLAQRIFSLLEELEAKKLFKKDKEGIKNRTEELVKIRKEDKKELQDKVKQAGDDVKAALGDQEGLETQIFETQKKLGELQQQAETMQYYIRRLEGVGGR